MPDRATLEALARRLEGGETGREIDFRIHHALFPEQRVLLEPGHIGKPPHRDPVWGPLSEAPVDGWDDYAGPALHVGAGHYTTSLDAAAALVESECPGERWMVGRHSPDFLDDSARHYWGNVVNYPANAANPAAGLMLALLRVLIARGDAS